jgi:transcriptional regulator with XRE-family HTH domain
MRPLALGDLVRTQLARRAMSGLLPQQRRLLAKGQGYRMAQGTTPVVQQRRLRAELRRAREDAGQTQKQVADELGWSLSKVIRLETGATAVSTSDAMALIHFYKITDQDRVEDLLSVTRARARSWWDEYSEVYSQRFLNFLAYEDSASRVRQFVGLGVPGLLQTRDYARGVFDAYLVKDSEIELAIKVRMRRQQLLERADGTPDETRFEFMLDEAVVHRLVGSDEVMIQQLTRLKELNDADNPSISIRIVPFTAGVNPGMKGSFTIFEFPSENEDFVVNIEEPNTDVLIRDNPETASNYVEAFLELEDIALSRAASSELLGSVIHAMRERQPS